MNKVIVHKYFSYNDCDKELIKLQAQIPSAQINPNYKIEGNIYSKIYTNNKEIFAIKNNEILCLWFDMFLTEDNKFKDDLINEIINCNLLLKTKYKTVKDAMNPMFREYLDWLKHIEITGSKYKKLNNKDVLKFLFIRNKKVFNQKDITKICKKEVVKLNPFIFYWLDSYILRQILKLPSETAFLPDIGIEEIQKLKEIKII